MTIKRTTFEPRARALWNEVEQMSQNQLEFSWLACIYYEAAKCRTAGGLRGLDATFFQHPQVFDLGLLLLRNLDYRSCLDADFELAEYFANNPIVSKMYELERDFDFRCCMFRIYAEELEKRKWIDSL